MQLFPTSPRTLGARLRHHWRAKLVSLLAAVALWYGIKREIAPPPAPPAPSAPAALRFP